MAKRTNENSQVRKEDYDHLTEQKSDDPGQIDKASKTIISGRRIVRGKQPRLNVDKPISSSIEDVEGGSNPFKNVNFGSNVPKHSNGTKPSNSPKASIVSNTFNFAGKGIGEKKSLLPLPGKIKNHSDASKLNLVLLRMIQMEERMNPVSDWSPWMKFYLAAAKDIENEWRDNHCIEDDVATHEPQTTLKSKSLKSSEPVLISQSNELTFGQSKSNASSSTENGGKVNGFNSLSSTSTNTASSTTTTGVSVSRLSPSVNPQKPSSSFSFAYTAAGASAPGLSSDNLSPSIKAPKPFSGFSFPANETAPNVSANNASTSPTVPKPFTGFNFSSPNTTGTITPGGNTTSRGIDINKNDDDKVKDEVEAVGKEDNKEEDCIMEIVAKHGKFIDKKWKMFEGGKLRLYRHKTTQKCRLVMRNTQVGKVVLNVAITKGMSFSNRIKGQKGYISFIAIENESIGIEKFLLVVQKDNAEDLHKALEGMVANLK